MHYKLFLCPHSYVPLFIISRIARLHAFLLPCLLLGIERLRFVWLYLKNAIFESQTEIRTNTLTYLQGMRYEIFIWLLYTSEILGRDREKSDVSKETRPHILINSCLMRALIYISTMYYGDLKASYPSRSIRRSLTTTSSLIYRLRAIRSARRPKRNVKKPTTIKIEEIISD